MSMSLRVTIVIGLSPHARGNRQQLQMAEPGEGSIPARAGQPHARVSETPEAEVYPRTRGATVLWRIIFVLLEGLSPHARGNHCQHGQRLRGGRSIPARAGQPLVKSTRHMCRMVYLRTRGATHIMPWPIIHTGGLSPHARGNPVYVCQRLRHCRSIPARAGQPGLSLRGPTLKRVYPRTRGATPPGLLGAVPSTGLSPHARGNLLFPTGCLRRVRSIPARAGQPAQAPL